MSAAVLQRLAPDQELGEAELREERSKLLPELGPMKTAGLVNFQYEREEKASSRYWVTELRENNERDTIQNALRSRVGRARSHPV